MAETPNIDIELLRQMLKEHKQTPHKMIADEPYLVGLSWCIQRLPKHGPCTDAYEVPDGVDYQIIKGCLTALDMQIQALERRNEGLHLRIETLERERGVHQASDL